MINERTARTIGDYEDRDKALAAAALGLAQREQLHSALGIAREIGETSERVKSLTALIRYLPEQQHAAVLAEGLTVARAIKDERQRMLALCALAPYFARFAQPEAALAEALTLARTIATERRRIITLIDLAPSRVQFGQSEPALAETRAIEHEGYRVLTLAALVPHLTKPQREAILAEALSSARAIREERWRAQSLAALVPHLAEPQREAMMVEALSSARAIESEMRRAQILLDLAPHLSLPLVAEALDAARAMRDQMDQTTVLVAVALRLAELAQPEEALAVVRVIQGEGDRVKGMAALASHLSESQRESVLVEAVGLARAIGSQQDRARPLAALIPHLPEAQRQSVLIEAVAAARSIDQEEQRGAALTALAPSIATLPVGVLNRLWLETLPVLATRARRDLLVDLRALVPVLTALGGAATLEGTVQSILTVTRWWPSGAVAQ